MNFKRTKFILMVNRGLQSMMRFYIMRKKELSL